MAKITPKELKEINQWIKDARDIVVLADITAESSVKAFVAGDAVRLISILEVAKHQLISGIECKGTESLCTETK